METVRPCGCKGIRTCLICETEYNISKPDLWNKLQNKPSYVYCPYCDKAWPGWDMDLYKEHPNHKGIAIDYPGVLIQPDFLSMEETDMLIKSLDDLPWELSQSGRRKQNFGPKCNFKRRRLRLGDFAGFPKRTKFVQQKFAEVPLLRDFQTVEQCTLEYTSERGASIDPHIDDCWIWGERIVTVNVIGDSTLTMIPYCESAIRYNLADISTYSSVTGSTIALPHSEEIPKDIVVRLPMPARSLMVLYGDARYIWEHCVLRQDISTRRVCLAYRELTPPYLPPGQHSNETVDVLKNATIFW